MHQPRVETIAIRGDARRLVALAAIGPRSTQGLTLAVLLAGFLFGATVGQGLEGRGEHDACLEERLWLFPPAGPGH
jgi:hypothetical protein